MRNDDAWRGRGLRGAHALKDLRRRYHRRVTSQRQQQQHVRLCIQRKA